METAELTVHQVELKEIFDNLPSANLDNADEEIKMINFGLLDAIVGKMMDKAYYHGLVNGMDSVENILKQSFPE